MESIRYVDEVFYSIDETVSVTKSLESLKPAVFAKGYSASASEIDICSKYNIEIASHVGNNHQIHLQDLITNSR